MPFLFSPRSLVKYLGQEHYDVNLSPEDRIHVTTWINSNGQYFGSNWGRKNLAHRDHPNFLPVLTFEQSHANKSPWLDDQR